MKLGLNVPLVTAAATTILCAGLYAAHRAQLVRVPYLDDAEARLVDARFQLRGPRPAGDEIVVVGLDDATHADAPEIFQTRRGWAKLVDALAAYGPKAVGIDAFFAAPEVVVSAPTLAKVKAAAAELDADPARAPAAAGALHAVLDETRGDELLADAVARAKVVHGSALLFLDAKAAEGDDEPPGLAPARYDDAFAVRAPASRRPPHATAPLLATMPSIARGLAGVGFVNMQADADGATRHMYLVIERGGRYYLPLALSLARVALGGAPASYAVGDDVVAVGDRTAPVDRRGLASLNFLGPGKTFPRVSALDVLRGAVPREALAGKLVLVGFTDAARDKVSTPFDPLYDGVELHATLLHNVLHGELLHPPDHLVTFFSILGLGALLTLLQLRAIRSRRAWTAVAVAAVAIVAFVAVAQLLFVRERRVVELAAPIGSFVLAALASLSTTVVVEGREKARLRSAFSQYLDERAVQQILADPERLHLGGERRELTVLFSDIRGFTRLSERLSPEQVSTFLNEYLTPMTEIVLESGGLLDKYIGDAVMAVYGAPLDQPDHAVRACRAAVAMQRRLAELNAGWAARGMPEIAVGIGLNSGLVSVGNMGSERRFNYTVVGDAVNLASRLETLTKEYRARVLVGERTRALAAGAADLRFRELDLVRVKGKDQPVRVHELDGGDDLGAFLAAYRARDWAAAERSLEAALTHQPGDGPAAVFLERVRALRGEELPSDWDGVFEQRHK